MKFRQVIANVDSFPIIVAYQELGTAEQLKQMALKAKIWDGSSWEPEKDCPQKPGDAKTYIFGSNTVIWAKHPCLKSIWRGYMIHECGHAALEGLTDIGMRFSADSIKESGVDEALMYLQQHLCEKFGVTK